MATVAALEADIRRIEARLGDAAAEASYRRKYGRSMQETIAGHRARIAALQAADRPAPALVAPAPAFPGPAIEHPVITPRTPPAIVEHPVITPRTPPAVIEHPVNRQITPVPPVVPVAAPVAGVTVAALLADIARLEARLGDAAAEASYRRKYGRSMQETIAGHRARIAEITGPAQVIGALRPGDVAAGQRRAEERAKREAAAADVGLFEPSTVQAAKEVIPLLVIGLVVLKIIGRRR